MNNDHFLFSSLNPDMNVISDESLVIQRIFRRCARFITP